MTTTDLIASATCDEELFMLCKIKNIFIMNHHGHHHGHHHGQHHGHQAFCWPAQGLSRTHILLKWAVFSGPAIYEIIFVLLKLFYKTQNISPQSVAFLTVADWFHFLRHLSKNRAVWNHLKMRYFLTHLPKKEVFEMTIYISAGKVFKFCCRASTECQKLFRINIQLIFVVKLKDTGTMLKFLFHLMSKWFRFGVFQQIRVPSEYQTLPSE